MKEGLDFGGDPLFFTSSVFVKTPERVEAIAMIMGLCLLVYNLAQRKLRQELAQWNDGIKNQVNKITKKPTMRWIFQMFQSGQPEIAKKSSEACWSLKIAFLKPSRKTVLPVFVGPHKTTLADL